jgi:hypothetical protein
MKCGKNRQKREEVRKMKSTQLSLFLLFLLGVLGYTPIAIAAAPPAQVNQPKGVKPGVIAAMPLNRAGTYCHLRFPAIRGGTLGTDKPRLKPATSPDIIDYYGPCDHDPLGKEEVESQIQGQEARKFDND